MGKVSANPTLLESFVDDVSPARVGAVNEQASLSGLMASVAAGCPGRAVDVPALGALVTVLGNMAGNETFVTTVKTALVEADGATVNAGVVTVDAAVVDVALAKAGVSLSGPVPVEFDPATREIVAPTSGMIDDPINASNGNMVHVEKDIEFPAIAAALSVARTWNSLLADQPGAFGAGWSSVFDVRLDVEPDRVVASLADGNVVAFVEWSNRWVAPGVPRLRLWRDDTGNDQTARDGAARDGAATDETGGDDSGWILQADTVRRFMFDSDGRLAGWQVGVAKVSLVRDESDRIIDLVEHVTGRSLHVDWTSEGLVDRLSTDDGRSVRYQRDGDGVLVGALSDAGSVRYAWDGPLLVSVVDADEVAAFVNVYDEQCRVAIQTSPFGRVSTYDYDESGLTVFSDAAGVVQAMRHDRWGNLIAVIDVDGSAMRLAYNDDRHVVQVVERDGAMWRYRYDGDDLVERVDPDGLSQRWQWDDRHRLVEDVDRTGAVTCFEYDTDHMAPSRVIGPDGAVVTQSLDERGLPTEIVDADGVVTRFVWDRDGQLAQTVDALGVATVFEYDDHGLLSRLAPPSGAPTVMGHDSHGRMVRTERGDAVWEYRYTAAGRVCGGVEPGDVGWSATFGSHGAVATVTDAAGSTVEFAYDAIGNVTTTTAPDGARYRHVFDEVGRLVAAVEPTGATTAKGYDRRGRLVEMTDPRGHVWRRQLDVLGRTTSSTGPDGTETSWTYHPNGEIASTTAPDGRAWRTEVDVVGRPVAMVDPAGGRALIEYTPAGRMRSRTSPAGRREEFEYDATGRLAVVVGADGVRREIGRNARGFIMSVVDDGAGDASAAEHVEYRWDDDYRLVGVRAVGPDGERESSIRRDAGGRVTEAIDATGVTSRFAWDERGLLARATDPAGLTTGYHYDTRGRLAGLEAPGGRMTGINYGVDGHAAAVTDPAGAVTRMERDAAGAVTGLRRSDGAGWDRRLDSAGRELERVGTDGTVAGRYGYDPAGRLVSATVPDTGVTVEFLWDENDRIEQITGPDGVRTIERDADGWVIATVDPDGVRTVFRRDARGRIIGANAEFEAGPAGGFGGPADGDGLGDGDGRVRDRAGRLTIGPNGTVFRYDDVGRIAEIAPVSQPSTSFTYDADGLVATERGPRGVRTYAYDAAGRVIAVALDGDGDTRIGYDINGRRVREDHPDGTVTVYRWDVFDRLAAIERHDTFGDVIGEVAVGYDALDRAVLVDGIPIGYHPVTGLPDGEQWAPGDERPLGGVPVGNVWVLGARVLDPVTHQFLSTDPLLPAPGTHGGASAYTYNWQDPVNWVDPTGMRPLSIEEFDAIQSEAEQGTLSKAWEAIKEDPWGTLAMVGVTAVGVGLCFTPLAPIGAGILIGVGTSAGIGLATGTFSPTAVAIGGAFGAIPGGSTLRGAVTIGAASGAGETVLGSVLTGQGFPSPTQLVTGTLLGGGGGGASRAVDNLMPPSATSQLDHTPTPSTAPRLSQDVDVNPAAPRALPLNRPVGGSPTQNQFVQDRIVALQGDGAIDMRVNQQQVDANGNRVGVNRPDLQYTLDGQRVYEEFDTTASTRGVPHQDRILSNDPGGTVNLFTVD